MSDILWRRLKYMLTPQFDIYRHIAQRLEGKDVLEVGFGSGLGTLQFEKANSVTAIEINSDAYNFARECFPNDICWTHDDFSSENYYATKKYDAVVMVEVLEHIPNWRVALRNAGRVLRDKGILYLTAPNAKADLRKNDLHEEELEVHEMRARLLEYFTGVEVKDYALNDETENTTKTPVLFLARK